jgi:hypothetical protein
MSAMSFVNGPAGVSVIGDASVYANLDIPAALAAFSGGLFHTEPIEYAIQTYHLTDDRLQELKSLQSKMYTAITQVYRLNVGASAVPGGSDLHVELSDEMHKRVPNAILTYPRKLVACVVQ